jgi:hypothetical protein
MLTIGRIAGCSGIVINIFRIKNQSKSHLFWRISFVVGLVVGPLIIGSFTQFSIPTTYDFPRFIMIVGALLVGIGAGLGNGCTSGHGICGMGRLSIRSVAATITFMTTAFITVFIVRHLLEL